MKLLFSIGHPAQFHFYKNIINELGKSHEIKILYKRKDVLEALFEKTNWNSSKIKQLNQGSTGFATPLNLLLRLKHIVRTGLAFKPDVIISSDPAASQGAYLLRVPCINFIDDDYDAVGFYARLTYPFTKTIVTPENVRVGKWHGKRVSYKGYMKLAYLHPNWFKPDENKLGELKGKSFSIIRLSALKAHHDKGAKGISYELLQQIITILEKKGRVLISSEKELPDNLQKYKANIEKSDMHHYLAHASIFVSDSQSMTGEAAMLGVPSVRITSFKGQLSVLEELEHTYKLTSTFEPGEEAEILTKLKEMVVSDSLSDVYENRKNKMLSEKTDVTAFAVSIIEQHSMQSSNQ